ncbi:MAG TPA: ABC transporter ATP-binding protein [Xanthobacteraceae bacterium]|nr:ABC transporter ATP-binding protein [Xanthobacteraceae bacterium]
MAAEIATDLGMPTGNPSLSARAPLLRLDSVYAGYGTSTVLRGITLDVADGEVVCLIGPNGAGKTTTIRAIAAQLPVSSGKIMWAGRDIAAVSSADVVGLGIATVPEGRRIFPELTVRENLMIGAYHRRRHFKGEGELDFAFEMFPRLKERALQLGGTLSGGEQQMLAIARALMARPRLLLLDEPSMGLAPILIEAVFTTIERVAREGVTVLLVEQNAEAALAIAARAYIMERGVIVLDGTAASIATDSRVQHSYLGVA